MKLIVEMELDGDWFVQSRIGPFGEPIRPFDMSKACHIIRRSIMTTSELEGKMMDGNGNTCGAWRIDE